MKNGERLFFTIDRMSQKGHLTLAFFLTSLLFGVARVRRAVSFHVMVKESSPSP